MTVLSCSCSHLLFTLTGTRAGETIYWSLLIGAMPAPFVHCLLQWQLTLPICQSLFALSFSLGTDKIWRKLSFTCLLCQPRSDRLFPQVSLTHLSCPLTAFLSIFAHFHFSLFIERLVVRCFGAQYSPRRLASICWSTTTIKRQYCAAQFTFYFYCHARASCGHTDAALYCQICAKYRAKAEMLSYIVVRCLARMLRNHSVMGSIVPTRGAP